MTENGIAGAGEENTALAEGWASEPPSLPEMRVAEAAVVAVVPNDFLVVGIGASAGGLEALKQFFAAVPAKAEMAFIVVTHQHSANVSMLPEILARHSQLAVQPVHDGTEVTPNVVYVAPAEDVSIDNGRLRLSRGVRASPHHPIDSFFASLAREYGSRAVGIVLSGTGSDGSAGVSVLKSAGGLVLAQSPETAAYSDMPANAVATRMVDAILPPGGMLDHLLDHPLASCGPGTAQERGDVTAALYRVLDLLRTRTGQDFTAYKKSTLWRRLERRMKARNVATPLEYARLLERIPEEVELLFRELLIRVTSFFRDPDVFEVLWQQLRSVFETWDDQRPFRAWVPACATGEEAYSLAIGIREILSELGKPVSVQIFATDLDRSAIDVARAGVYPATIEAGVSPRRLQRFFAKTDSGYRISKDIRESIVFAPQNMIKDPPFTRLDLLSCRNVLIYLEPQLQRRVLALFSYSLKTNGLLLLGSSESIVGFDHAFDSIEKKNKLFRRRDTQAESPSEFVDVAQGSRQHHAERPKVEAARAAIGFSAVAERALLANLAPPSVLTTERGDIAYFHGRTGKFLEPAAGEPVSNLFSMIREGLRLDLSAALRQAATRVEPVVRSGIRVQNDGGFMRVELSVRRLDDPEAVRGMFLVSFEEQPEPELDNSGVGKFGRPSSRPQELETELQHTRDNLQATIEELETSNEELKSTNEELQSTNEELQSANEELETSREEMQSLNEELTTVNSEMEERNRELSQANDDMQNLLNSTDVATVFLDDTLAIKRFTTQARKVFSLIDTDIGRPISDLSTNLRYQNLVADAREVLRSLVFQEREIQTKEGAWRTMRITPYRTAENVIDGLVMTFVDIDRIKREQEASENARGFAEALVEALPAAVTVLDSDLRLVTANAAFFRAFKTNAKRSVGEPIQSVANGVMDVPELIERLPELFRGAPAIAKLALTLTDRRLGTKGLSVSAQQMATRPDEPPMVLLLLLEEPG